MKNSKYFLSCCWPRGLVGCFWERVGVKTKRKKKKTKTNQNKPDSKKDHRKIKSWKGIFHSPRFHILPFPAGVVPKHALGRMANNTTWFSFLRAKKKKRKRKRKRKKLQTKQNKTKKKKKAHLSVPLDRSLLLSFLHNWWVDTTCHEAANTLTTFLMRPSRRSSLHLDIPGLEWEREKGRDCSVACGAILRVLFVVVSLLARITRPHCALSPKSPDNATSNEQLTLEFKWSTNPAKEAHWLTNWLGPFHSSKVWLRARGWWKLWNNNKKKRKRERKKKRRCQVGLCKGTWCELSVVKKEPEEICADLRDPTPKAKLKIKNITNKAQ